MMETTKETPMKKPKSKLINLYTQKNPKLITLWQNQRKLTPKRFRKLADFLETLPRKGFSMTSWMTQNPSCGTKGCIGGWAATLPFAKKGEVKLFLQESPYTFENSSILSASIPPKYVGLRTTIPRLEEEEALIMFFGLLCEEMQHIFFGFTHTKKRAIQLLREYANLIEKEMRKPPKDQPQYDYGLFSCSRS